jgi:hypothetical protein
VYTWKHTPKKQQLRKKRIAFKWRIGEVNSKTVGVLIILRISGFFHTCRIYTRHRARWNEMAYGTNAINIKLIKQRKLKKNLSESSMEIMNNKFVHSQFCEASLALILWRQFIII